MQSIISRYSNFKSVWHFTDRSNLDLIKQHGLLSLAEIEKRGIEIPAPGGNQWSHDADKMKSCHEYVHLAFTNNHPMQHVASQDGRIKNTVWLKIDISVILEENVRFCADVANKSGISLLTAEQAKNDIDFEALFVFKDFNQHPGFQDRKTRAYKSEILVPTMIPASKIQF